MRNFMFIHTGSVDTVDGWIDSIVESASWDHERVSREEARERVLGSDDFVEVVKDSDGDWEEVV